MSNPNVEPTPIENDPTQNPFFQQQVRELMQDPEKYVSYEDNVALNRVQELGRQRREYDYTRGFYSNQHEAPVGRMRLLRSAARLALTGVASTVLYFTWKGLKRSVNG